MIIINIYNWNSIFAAPCQATVTFIYIDIKVDDGSIVFVIIIIIDTRVEAIMIKVPSS